MSAEILMLDVREDIRCGREPFTKIMQAVAGLQGAKELLLIAPFEPAPLYAVLSKQGFEHEAKATTSGDWEVRFTRRNGNLAGEKREKECVAQGDQAAGVSALEVIEVDARGLEPPQPLVRILEAASELGAGAQLNARTDRRPMHLYAQLEERGFTAETQEQPDGSFLTYVRRQ
jgi:uncharacterized protein (DUF2249 family)